MTKAPPRRDAVDEPGNQSPVPRRTCARSPRILCALLLLFLFALVSCDSQISNGELYDSATKGDESAESQLLSRSGADAGEYQEKLGDYWEMKDPARAERCWEAARSNGRKDAGRGFWHSDVGRGIRSHWLLLAILLGIGVLVVYGGVKHHEKRQIERANEQDERKRQQKLNEAERNRQRKRQEVMKSPWWNLPSQRTLVLDTCIWMQPKETGLDVWLDWVVKYAANQQWKLVLLNCVLEEIDYHAKHGNKQQVPLAILARKRVKRAQRALRARNLFVLSEGALANVPKYADPQILEYLKKHGNTLVFTNDNKLTIQARDIVRDPKRVIEWSDFRPFPKNRA